MTDASTVHRLASPDDGPPDFYTAALPAGEIAVLDERIDWRFRFVTMIVRVYDSHEAFGAGGASVKFFGVSYTGAGGTRYDWCPREAPFSVRVDANTGALTVASRSDRDRFIAAAVVAASEAMH